MRAVNLAGQISFPLGLFALGAQLFPSDWMAAVGMFLVLGVLWRVSTSHQMRRLTSLTFGSSVVLAGVLAYIIESQWLSLLSVLLLLIGWDLTMFKWRLNPEEGFTLRSAILRRHIWLLVGVTLTSLLIAILSSRLKIDAPFTFGLLLLLSLLLSLTYAVGRIDRADT